MKNYVKPRQPSDAQLEAMKRRYTISNDGKLIVSSRDKTRMPKVGAFAGTLQSQGHLSVGVMGQKFRCHHIVYFLTNGEWPKEPVYHRNACKTDNSPANIVMIGHKPENDAGMVVNL